MNRLPIQKPSAAKALERILMEQQEKRDTEEETFDPNEEQSSESSDFAARIAEKKAQRELMKSAQKASDEEAARFAKADTKVSVGDVGFERQPPKRESIPVTSRPVAGSRDKLVADRTKQWTTFLVEDFNPLLVKATSTFVGIPDEQWLHGIVLSAIKPGVNGAKDEAINFWDPPLKTRLELSDKKAKTLAKAAAEFSVSPMGVAIVTWVETHQFMLAMGAAMLVAAQYGWTLMQTKAEIAQVKTIVEQQQQAMAAAMHNGETRLPGFQEKTNESQS